MKNIMILALYVLFSLNINTAIAAEPPVVTDQVVKINLTTQSGEFFEDSKLLKEFKVSTGILSAPTPKGKTTIVKFGGEKGSTTRISKEFDGCALPWAMELGFKDDEGKLRGICMHAGLVLPHPASHACIRLDPEVAEFLYNRCLVSALTRVEIDGSTAEFYTKNFAHRDLLNIDGENITFKRTKDGKLTPEFLAAAKSHALKLSRFKKGSETERTEDQSQWVIGFPFMLRENCVSFTEYQTQIGQTVRVGLK